jgi:hypothetical protein
MKEYQERREAIKRERRVEECDGRWKVKGKDRGTRSVVYIVDCGWVTKKTVSEKVLPR